MAKVKMKPNKKNCLFNNLNDFIFIYLKKDSFFLQVGAITPKTPSQLRH